VQIIHLNGPSNCRDPIVAVVPLLASQSLKDKFIIWMHISVLELLQRAN
jgi:hypothetical protein